SSENRFHNAALYQSFGLPSSKQPIFTDWRLQPKRLNKKIDQKNHHAGNKTTLPPPSISFNPHPSLLTPQSSPLNPKKPVFLHLSIKQQFFQIFQFFFSLGDYSHNLQTVKSSIGIFFYGGQSIFICPRF